jgi:hypothetical protein
LKLVKTKSLTLERKEFVSRITEWARTRALQNAVTIAQTDLKDVKRIIESGLRDGLGQDEIARDIIDEASYLTRMRAATIARTETHSAATFGALEQAKQSEQEGGLVLLKSWVPTQDERTRPEHSAMASQPPIPVNEQFVVGGEPMDRPGDPSASAENVINCRCAIIFEEA